jgi:hypothetical protein
MNRNVFMAQLEWISNENHWDFKQRRLLFRKMYGNSLMPEMLEPRRPTALFLMLLTSLKAQAD